MKKIILMIGLLFVSVFTTGFTTVNASSFDNNLMQESTATRTKRLANGGGYSSIELTNVSYDLKILYGGDKPNSYDLNKLLPNANNDKDINFKFYCIKPVEDTLYLYLYHKEVTNTEVNYAVFNISTSKVQNTDGSWADSYRQYNARFINSYGYQGRFMKFAIDAIVNSNDSFRFAIKDVVINYKNTNGSTFSRGHFEINDEAFIKLGSNATDFVYEYYKDDYIRIIDGLVHSMIIPKDRYYVGGSGNIYSSANEEFYYFFSTDRQIDELVEIQYDYQYLTFDAKMIFKDGSADTETGKSYGNGRERGSVYGGYYNGQNHNTGDLPYQNNAEKITLLNTEYKQNNSIKMGTYVQSVQRENFLWWGQTVKYTMNNIQSALDTSTLIGDEYEPFKNMISTVQNQRVKDNKDKFQWTFKVVSDERYVYDAWTEWEWWSFLTLTIAGNKSISMSRCHEVNQAMITWLHFRTNGQDFKLNALDIPKDTTSTSVGYVPYDTLLEVVGDNVTSFFSAFGNILGNLANNIVPILILVASIMLLIIAWPILSAVFSIVGGTVKHTGNTIIDRKEAKRKKRRDKQNE